MTHRTHWTQITEEISLGHKFEVHPAECVASIDKFTVAPLNAIRLQDVDAQGENPGEGFLALDWDF